MNCNGQGLISTGDNKLDLKRGNTVVCPVCSGKGKVDQNQIGGGVMPDGEMGGTGDVPKADDSNQSAPGGSESSDSVGGEPAGPQIGSKCETGDGQPGTLGKNDAGDWVCNPDPA